MSEVLWTDGRIAIIDFAELPPGVRHYPRRHYDEDGGVLDCVRWYSAAGYLADDVTPALRTAASESTPRLACGVLLSDIATAQPVSREQWLASWPSEYKVTLRGLPAG